MWVMEVDAIRKLSLLGSLILILSGVVVSVTVIALPSPNPELKQEIDDTWYLSEPFTLTDNISFTVVIQSVEITFLCYYAELRMTDIPTTLFFVVHFSDGITEYLVSAVGGMLYLDHRLVVTEHTVPQAAIISAFGDGDDWYSWYYAVSPDATTPAGESVFYSTLYYSIAGLAWVIALSFIAYDYRKRSASRKL